MKMDTLDKREVKYTFNVVGWLMCIITAMVGNTIHGSVFWTIMDFLFAPLPWIKWLLFKEVNLTIIKHTFDWFLK